MRCRWEDFLLDMMGGDAEAVAFLRRVFGRAVFVEGE